MKQLGRSNKTSNHDQTYKQKYIILKPEKVQTTSILHIVCLQTSLVQLMSGRSPMSLVPSRDENDEQQLSLNLLTLSH